jgi:histidine triad (HIT) family protein
MPETIFSKIIRKEIPADIVYEDNDVLAFNDIDPKAPVHILINPKKEIATLNELDNSPMMLRLMGKIIIAAKKIANEKGSGFKDGYRLVMNCNEDGGQTVFHIHCHLMGGRKMQWPPG